MSFGDRILPNHTRSLRKLIIGLDFGTTYSGVSYVSTDKSDPRDINIIMSWPDGGGTWKTPTRIAYARENPKLNKDKWGFDVQAKHTSYSWTKLLLDKNAAATPRDDPALFNVEGSGMLRLPDFRNAEGVCEDFLRKVYDHTSKKIREEITTLTFDATPQECWITLPAIWSDEAKDATLRAARNAGFGCRPGDEIFTIAEPEAAAIYTLRMCASQADFNPIKVNDNVLICDAGGGTTDLTTYKITKISPHLEFDELLTGAGGKCGSTYIDRNFDSLMTTRFGSDYTDLPEKLRGPGSELMQKFELHKKRFGESDDGEVMEVGPVEMDLPDSDLYDSEECFVKLSDEDMRELFDPVVDDIKGLLRQQVRDAKSKKNAKIDRIILVGGFAESPFLFNELEEWCWKRGGDVKLIRPEKPQAAIMRGAALRGLEGIAPRVKHVRRHYGIDSGCDFREGVDPEDSSFLSNFDNRKLCRNRMSWLISKGDEIIEGTSRTVSFSRDYTPGKRIQSEDKLYSSSCARGPEHSTHSRVEVVGVIKTDIAANFAFGSLSTSNYNQRLGKTVYHFSYEIKVIFGNRGSNLVFQTLLGEDIISTATIEYDRG